MRGAVDPFETSEGTVGKILATVEKDVLEKKPLLVYLNVSKIIFNQLIELHKANLKPKSITLDFDEELSELTYAHLDEADNYDYLWDNLCKFRVDADRRNFLSLTNYKLNY